MGFEPVNVVQKQKRHALCLLLPKEAKQSMKYVFPDSRNLAIQQIPKEVLDHLAKLQLVSFSPHAPLVIISFVAHTNLVYVFAGSDRAKIQH
jgi:predicted 3-demethylubiquinone-9 3-methyltransferase (glyoxalase superfamily)